MPDITPRLGLRRPLLTDPFLVADFQFNLDQLELYPGIRPVLSTSLPTWGTSQAGMTVLETDTGRIKRWTGAAWAVVEQYSRVYRGAYETTEVLHAGGIKTYSLAGLNITPIRPCTIFFQMTVKFTQDTGSAQAADVSPYVSGSNTVGGTSVGPVAGVRFGDAGSGAAGRSSQFVTLYGSFAAAAGTAYALQTHIEVASGTSNDLTFAHTRGMAWLSE